MIVCLLWKAASSRCEVEQWQASATPTLTPREFSRGWKKAPREVLFLQQRGSQVTDSSVGDLKSLLFLLLLLLRQVKTGFHIKRQTHTSLHLEICIYKLVWNTYFENQSSFWMQDSKCHHVREIMSPKIISCKCLCYLCLVGVHQHHAGMYQPTVQDIRWVCLPL